MDSEEEKGIIARYHENEPNRGEAIFMLRALSRFFSLHKEILDEDFWKLSGYHRLSKIKDVFLVYSEILNLDLYRSAIDNIKGTRPSIEADIGQGLFKTIRNIIIHFPLFDSWNEIWVSKEVINWNESGQTIDKFFEKFKGHEAVKYRFWEGKDKKMTYISISFPKEYNDNNKIYLEDILNEKEGIKFALIFMKKIVDSQLIGIGEVDE